MKLDEIMANARETFTVRRVFSEPYAQDGTTVITAAKVSGGGGGGGGHDQQGQEGEGGGFGVNARPAGAYVIKNGKVQWVPAVDVNRTIAVVGVVAVVFMLCRLRMAKLRAKQALKR